MKTAIYIPDNIFSLAEKIAKRLNISRSEFYSRAIKEYIEDFHSEDITQQLNAVYGDNDGSSKIDEGLQIAQVSVLENEEW
jgi:metal-responsive CopG/Arc/MetJ family transcriptional regulator